jgi:hypothetical protein
MFLLFTSRHYKGKERRKEGKEGGRNGRREGKTTNTMVISTKLPTL